MRCAEILQVQEFKEFAIDAFSPTMKTKLFSTYCTELTLNTMVHYFHFFEIRRAPFKKKIKNPWPSVTNRPMNDLVLWCSWCSNDHHSTLLFQLLLYQDWNERRVGLEMLKRKSWHL